MTNNFDFNDKTLLSYIATALWSSNDTVTNEDGEEEIFNLDEYDYTDLSQETLDYLKETLESFLTLLEEQNLLESALGYADLETIAHDLWLTQNGHGAGFWDGDYGDKLGKDLTVWAKSMGSIDLYIGDDGLIYHM